MKLGPTLEERVRHLEDRVAIGELIARYCLAMDNSDVGALESLFTPDARIWSADGVIDARGRQAAVEMFKRRIPALGPRNHFNHDRIVEFDHVDPDRATGLVLAHAEMRREGQPMLAAIRYQDVYQRCEGRWRFRERALSFTHDVPASQCHSGRST